MIAAHKMKEYGAHFITPISGLTCHLAGGLFVDDTDPIHIDICSFKTTKAAHVCLQELVINWGELLLATGGVLKPAKCSFYLQSF